MVAVGTTDDLLSKPVGDRFLYCFQHIVVEDETSLLTSVRLYKNEPAGNFLLDEHVHLSAGVPYSYDEVFYLYPRQRIMVRCVGATAGDSLKAYLSGWYQDDPGMGEA